MRSGRLAFIADLDEDISIKGLLLGNKSGRSPKSLQRWLDYRSKGKKVPGIDISFAGLGACHRAAEKEVR